jgi:hypothetical protein
LGQNFTQNRPLKTLTLKHPIVCRTTSLSPTLRSDWKTSLLTSVAHNRWVLDCMNNKAHQPFLSACLEFCLRTSRLHVELYQCAWFGQRLCSTTVIYLHLVPPLACLLRTPISDVHCVYPSRNLDCSPQPLGHISAPYCCFTASIIFEHSSQLSLLAN